MANLREYQKKKYKAEKNTDYEEVDYDAKIKAHKRRTLIFALSVIVILLLSIVALKIFIDRRTYDDYSVKKTIKLGDTYGCKFYSFGDYILRYSNDGITCLDGTDTIWNQPFEMKTPLIDVCESTIAIAETGGTTIYIYNQKGSMGQIQTEYPIENLDVAAQGVVSVVTSDDEINYFEVYDKKGSKLVSGRAVLTGETGYPLDMSMSNDGTKMIVTFLNVENATVNTKVVFYNFSEVGKNEVDRIVGVFGQYGATVVPKVEFINNNCAVAFGDDIYTIYSMKQKPSKVYEEKIANDVKSIFYSEDYIGIVTKNDDLNNPYKVKVVDTDGKSKLEKKFNMEYTNIKFDGKNVMLYNSTQLMVISFNGVVKYNKNFESEISDILVTDDKYTYMVVTTTGIEKIKLK